MSTIQIKAASQRMELIAGLRRLLPSLSVAQVKAALAAGDVVLERELFANDWGETHPLIRAVLIELHRHGATIQIVEVVGDSSSRIEESTLENIMSAHADEVAKSRRERQPKA